ncbi:hypothetical protein Tco_0581263 [Tanacetum coccineum]
MTPPCHCLRTKIVRTLQRHIFILNGRIKEFASLNQSKNALILRTNRFSDLNVSYIGELWVHLEFYLSVKSKEAFRDNVGVSSWFSEIRQASFDINPDGRIVWVEIEGVPLKLWTLNTFKRIVTRFMLLMNRVINQCMGLLAHVINQWQERYVIYHGGTSKEIASRSDRCCAALRNIDLIHSMDLDSKRPNQMDNRRR